MTLRVKHVLLLIACAGLCAAMVGVWLAAPHEPVAVAEAVEPIPMARPEAERRAATASLALAMVAAAERNASLLDPFQLEVAQAARGFLIRRPRGFRDDCSGFVSAVFSQVGVPMDGLVATIWDNAVDHDALHWDEVPAVGDLVFFDDTWDRNGNGRVDDALTHIAVVIDVEPDGTIVYAHSGTSRGRSVGRMNLVDPHLHEDPATGARWNDYLREPEPWDPPEAMYLSGELWVGFGRVDPSVDWL